MRLFGDDPKTGYDPEKYGARVEGDDDPSKPVLINSKEWAINRYDPVEAEVETYAGAWPRAMIENAQAEPEQPLWIGVSENSGREVPIDFDRIFRHVFYGGSTGTGKTTKMYNDAVALMYGSHGITIIDPKGDDIYDLLRRVPKARWDDVIYIAPGDDYLDQTIGFNLFSTYHDPDEPGFDEEIEGIVDDFKNLIAAGEYWGPRMDRIMKTMVRGMVRHPREFTPIEMYYTLLEEDHRQQYADLLGDEVDDDDIMFLEGFTNRIANELGDSELDPLIGRLKDWVENPMTRQIIAQRESNVSIAEAVNEGKIVIVKNNLPDEAQTMIATAVMRRIWTCVTDRVSESEQKVRDLAGVADSGADYEPYFLMIDECDDVLTEASQIDTMLTKARSKRLGLMLATQTLHQLDEDAQQAILSNCNTLVSLNPLLPDEAHALAKRFGSKEAEDLTQIPDYHAQTKLRHEDESFLAKLTPPYPPLHSIEEAFELVQLSLDEYGVDRQSGREILDQMFFAETAQSAMADEVGLENTRVSEGEMDVDETETAQAALKAIYDACIRQGTTAIAATAASEVIDDATGLDYSQASNLVERLSAVDALEQRRTDDGLEYSVTADGKAQIGLETGSGGSGGTETHRWLLERLYKWGTRQGYNMTLPSQDDDGELPDAVANLPHEVVPEGGLDDDHDLDLLEARLRKDYPVIAALSGTQTLYLEAESKGISKPAGPIKNLAKAPSPEQVLFVVADGGSDGLTANAEKLSAQFGADGSDNYVSLRSPSDAARKFYTKNRLVMNPDAGSREMDKFAVLPGDTSTEWIELQSGAIVCRDRGGGDTYLRFETVAAFRDRSPSDAPAVTYYDRDRDGFVVEMDGDIERRYGGKEPLTGNLSWIYKPSIPKAVFDRHGHEAVPNPQAVRIAIVPNDDRDLEGELLLFDHETGDCTPIVEWAATDCDDEQDDGQDEPDDQSFDEGFETL